MSLTANFSIGEFASSHRGTVTPVPDSYLENVTALARNLQVLCDHLGKAITITSSYRTKEHNAAVGGVSDSQHRFAKAADFAVEGTTPADAYCAVERLIAQGSMQDGGLGIYVSHVHYDVGPARRWSKGAPVPECPPTPQPDPVEDPRKEDVEEDKMVRLVRAEGQNYTWATDGMSRWLVPNPTVLQELKGKGIVKGAVETVTKEALGAIPVLKRQG